MVILTQHLVVSLAIVQLDLRHAPLDGTNTWHCIADQESGTRLSRDLLQKQKISVQKQVRIQLSVMLFCYTILA